MVAMDCDQEGDGEREEGGRRYKRASGEILLEMELFCIFTVSMSYPACNTLFYFSKMLP